MRFRAIDSQRADTMADTCRLPARRATGPPSAMHESMSEIIADRRAMRD